MDKANIIESAELIQNIEGRNDDNANAMRGLIWLSLSFISANEIAEARSVLDELLSEGKISEETHQWLNDGIDEEAENDPLEDEDED